MTEGFTIWLTGPSGAGKTVLANILKKKLKKLGYRVEVLDGDAIRKTLYPGLGFSKEAREMHNKIVIYMAKLLSRNGVIAIVSLISPYRSIREYARREIGRFIEVYVYAPLEVRIKRDPKGLYRKAIHGEIKELTGYDGVYEEPDDPEIVVDSSKMTPEEEAKVVLRKARELGYLP